MQGKTVHSGSAVSEELSKLIYCPAVKFDEDFGKGN